MKKIVYVALSALMLTAFCACGEEGERGSSGGSGNELYVWSVEGPLYPGYEGKEDGDSYTTKFVIDKFHEYYPDVKITLKNYGKDTDLNSTLQTAFITNDMPDIVVGESFIKSQIELGYFQDIQIPEDVKKNVRPEILQLTQWEGKQYGVTFYAGVDELLYNENLLKEALGEDPQYFEENGTGDFIVPTTMDDLLRIAQTVKDHFTEKGLNDYGGIQINNVKGLSSAFRATYIMSAFGGSWLDENGNLDLVTDANKQAFEYLRNMGKAASFGATGFVAENDVITQFLNGKAAFAIDHPSMLADYTKGGIKAAAIPAGSDGKQGGGVLVGTASYMMTKACVNPEAAMKFLEILVSKEVQEQIYTHSSLRLPIRKDVQEELLASKDPAVLAVHEKYLPGLRTLYDGDLVNGLPYFPTNQYTQIWNDNWTQCIGKVFTSNTDVGSLLTELQNNISAKLR